MLDAAIGKGWLTADEALAWLSEQTQRPWTVRELLGSHPKAAVWLAPRANESVPYMQHLFQGRSEGFMAPLIFQGDYVRLAFERSGALSMTRRPDGELLRFAPPIEFELSDVRFAPDGLQVLLRTEGNATVGDAPAPAQRVLAGEAHQQTILQALRTAGFQPLKLPPRPSGKPWAPKQKAYDAWPKHLSKSVFEKTWSSLRGDKLIKEVDPQIPTI